MLLKDKVSEFPEEPGVYVIRSKGEVIYVGKSASLRGRVQSYFHSNSSTSAKTRALREEADDIDYIVTESEVEALILEENLIKEHRPRYNVLLKDNKRYPYLKITSEKFPAVVVTRRRSDSDGELFGPYTDAGAMRETLDTLKKIFPIKDCSWSAADGKRRPCLRYYIGRCSAPCAGKIDEDGYQEYIDKVRDVLNGNHDKVIDSLREKMEEAAEKNEFEKAAEWRDKICALEKIGDTHNVRLNDELDRDFVALERRADEGVIQVFFVRRGRISGQDSYQLEFPPNEEDGTVVGEFLKKFYANRGVIPAEILVSAKPDDRDIIEEWLGELRSGEVEIKVPRRGSKRKVLEMAGRNAKFTFGPGEVSKAENGERGVIQLMSELGLETPPKRIEGYDISNISGTDSVGSMVVFTDGKKDKSNYRRFKISDITGPDDYGMIKQVLRRRFIHEDRSEEDDESFSTYPDLLLIDGGKGQVNAVADVMEELDLADVPLIGLAKEFEDVYKPGESEPLDIDKDSEGLQLLQRVRDEAHRFALDYHRRLRQKRTVRSSLDSIDGVGPKRKSQLINAFKSVEGVRKASLEEIKALPNMPENVAERIYHFLHGWYK